MSQRRVATASLSCGSCTLSKDKIAAQEARELTHSHTSETGHSVYWDIPEESVGSLITPTELKVGCDDCETEQTFDKESQATLFREYHHDKHGHAPSPPVEVEQDLEEFDTVEVIGEMQALDRFEEGVPLPYYVCAAQEFGDVDASTALDRLDKRLKWGEMYQPRTNHYRSTSA